VVVTACAARPRRAPQSRFGDEATDGGRQRGRILAGYEKAGASDEQFNGMREGGGYDRYAGADGLGEYAGGDLVEGVVGKDDHARGADQAAQRRVVVVARAVVDGVGHTELAPRRCRPARYASPWRSTTLRWVRPDRKSVV